MFAVTGFSNDASRLVGGGVSKFRRSAAAKLEMQKKRQFGLTGGLLDGVFLAGVAAIIAGAGGWVFGYGGLDVLRGAADESVAELEAVREAVDLSVPEPEPVDGIRPAADETLREISDEELSRMVLSLGLLGSEFASFAPEADNGAVNIDTASKDDFDAVEERADLERSGFASGYQAFYSYTIGTVSGSAYIGSQAALFQTAEGAADYMEDSDRENAEYAGKTVGSVTILEIERFDVRVLADEAAGARGTARFAEEGGSSTDVWIVAVDFRRGRLIGSVGLFAVAPSEQDKKDLSRRVETLAELMNQQMRTTLAARAVPTPAKVR